jgi:phage terminase large subunit-like protein
VGSVFGWKRQDEDSGEWIRRFRVAYHEVARKNGKTTEAAGVALYMMDADGEPGADVYSAATKRDQAKIVWNDAAKMVRRSKALANRINVLPGKCNMSVEETASKFEPLGADEDTLDGLNIHCAIIDELHAHRTRGVWDVLETAMGSRQQPLTWAITTAGFDQSGICFEVRTYSVEVLEGRIQDDSWFAYIATLDEGDDWKDESCWIKANPNLGVSVSVHELRNLAEKAKRLPAAQNNLQTKRFNVWTQQADRWIDLDLWDENAGLVVEENLVGRACYGGLDLASVSDIVAWLMVFPGDKDPEELDVLARFWCPESRVYADDNKYRDQYQAWVKQGFLTATPGNATDYAFVKKQIMDDASKFGLVDSNVDRLFQAHEISTNLTNEGLVVIGMGQGFTSMAAPMQECERRLLVHKIHHGGNPVLRWMAGNVSVKRDPAGNLKPDKATSQGKIDGIVSLVMALGRAMRHEKGKGVLFVPMGGSEEHELEQAIEI